LGDPTNGIPPAHHPTGETLWRNLRADFREAYQDTAAENEAVYLRLSKLCNIENRINEYTDHFKVLETEWSKLDKKPRNLLNIERRIDKCIKHLVLPPLINTPCRRYKGGDRNARDNRKP